MAEVTSGGAAAAAESDGSDIVRWARIALLVLLVALGWHAFHDEYGYIPLLGDIDTAVHEFGHMLFMPFGIPILGDTMVTLGGSLTQVAFPTIFVAYFLRRRKGKRDVFAAMVCLWWTSINLLGVAIYANDARAGQLMLINGETGPESDAHDWRNLLSQWGALKSDHAIAGTMRRIAWLMFLISIGVAAYVTYKQTNRSNRQSSNRHSSNRHSSNRQSISRVID